MNKKVLYIVISVILIATVAFMMGKQKLVSSNESNETIEYSDKNGEYISSINSTLDYSDKGTYTQTFKIQEGHSKSLSIANNTLNKDFELLLENKNGKILFSKIIKKKETSSFDQKYKQGEYVLKYKLVKDTKGTVEIQIND